MRDAISAGDHGRPGRVEALGDEIHDVGDPLGRRRSRARGRTRREAPSRPGHDPISTGSVETDIGLACRTQKRGGASARVRQRHRELQLHRAVQRITRHREQPCDERGERQLVEHEKRGEREDARPRASEARHEPLRARIERRGREGERAVRLGVRERRVNEVFRLARRVVLGRIAHPDRPESRLRLSHEIGGGTVRRHRLRPCGTERPGGLSLDDRAAEAEGKLADALFRGRPAEAIERQRPRDAGHVRVVARLVSPADDLLHEDRHALALCPPRPAPGTRAPPRRTSTPRRT